MFATLLNCYYFMNTPNLFSKSAFAIIKIYLLSIGFFSIFRGIIFISQIINPETKASFPDSFMAFLMGIRFDTVVSCYILILPFVVLFLLSFFNKIPKTVFQIIFGFIILFFSISFLVCCTDIPYFNYFYSRFSIAAFQWLETPDIMFKMIFQERQYWGYLIPYLIIIYLFYIFSKKYFNPILHNSEPKKKSKTLFSLIILVMIFLGIRGSLSPISPIRVSSAYFCDNSFLNQLGLNPNFTLLRSYIESKKKDNQFTTLMDDNKAVAMVQNNLGISNSKHPFARNITCNPNSEISKMNVILVIMESMSAEKTEIGGNKNNLTPFLDSLSTKGYFFKNTYSSGIHTYNGIYSTLFSFPALFRQHPLRDSNSIKHQSIFTTLKNNDYSTIYFTTHDGYYDNIEGFLKGNDCQKIVTVADYPEEEVKTAFGVPDDFMFRFSIPVLNKLSEKNKPFIATLMTTSDHGPYFIPKYFKPTAKNIDQQATQYADYSLKKMMQLASKQKWFNNTLFVFIADHGVALDKNYEMPLSYNHVPMLFYAPKLVKKPQTFSKMASQIDVYPTIMGLLNIPYQNTTLGIDLLRENRPYSYFNGDDKYGVIDKNWYLMVKEDKSNYLYKYQSKDPKDYAKNYPEVVSKMNNYAKSNLQAYQYYLKK